MKLNTKIKLLLSVPKKKCKFCKSKDNLTYDHILPVVRGGTDDLKNIQVLCRTCNQIKSNLSNKDLRRIVIWWESIKDKRGGKFIR